MASTLIVVFGGVNDAQRGVDPVETERNVMWGSPGKGAMFGVITPYDGQEATPGNGTMFGFNAETEEQVHACIHRVRNHGVQDVLVQGDVTQEDDVVRMVHETVDGLGRPA